MSTGEDTEETTEEGEEEGLGEKIEDVIGSTAANTITAIINLSSLVFKLPSRLFSPKQKTSAITEKERAGMTEEEYEKAFEGYGKDTQKSIDRHERKLAKRRLARGEMIIEASIQEQTSLVGRLKNMFTRRYPHFTRKSITPKRKQAKKILIQEEIIHRKNKNKFNFRTILVPRGVNANIHYDSNTHEPVWSGNIGGLWKAIVFEQIDSQIPDYEPPPYEPPPPYDSSSESSDNSSNDDSSDISSAHSSNSKSSNAGNNLPRRRTPPDQQRQSFRERVNRLAQQRRERRKIARARARARARKIAAKRAAKRAAARAITTTITSNPECWIGCLILIVIFLAAFAILLIIFEIMQIIEWLAHAWNCFTGFFTGSGC